MSERAPPNALAAMFVVSGAILVLQVSLSRVLSVLASYHAAFVVTSLAMLGLTASAIDAYVHKHKSPATFTEDAAARAAGTAGLAIALSLVALLQLGRSDTLALVGLFVGVLGVLATFHQGGFVVAWLLDRYAADVSRVYFVDLVGAAAGCAIAVTLLGLVSAPVAMVASGAAIAAVGLLLAKDRRFPAVAAVTALVLLVLGVTTPLYAVRRAKDQRQDDVLWERWNSLARVSVVERVPGLDQAVALLREHQQLSDADAERLQASWRIGWGASDRYAGFVPRTLWIQLDADAGTPIIEGGATADLQFLAWDVTSAAHHLRRDAIERAFVIGGGGGRDVLTALHFGAKHVDVVEINPAVVDVVRHGFPDFVKAPAYDDPRVSLTIGEGRSALARSESRYDLVQMSLVDTWAASMAGAMVLSENTLYTQEAFDAYVDHLADRGVLTVSRWYDPAAWGETARVVRLASDALRHAGIEHPEDHVAVLYSRGYFPTGVATVIASRAPLGAADLATITQMADTQGYGVLWPRTPVTQDHGWDVGAVVRGDPQVFDDPVYDLSSPTDERPFFFNVRWPFASWLGAINAKDPTLGSVSTQVFGGALLLLGTFGLALITRPLRELQVRLAPAPVAYFGGLGVGFMAIEMALVQRYIVFLGHPTYALSVVLFALLLGSGLGSGLSGRFSNAERAVPVVVAAVIAATLLSAFAIPPVLLATLAQPLPARVAIAIAGIAPQAVCMGMLWPLGVRLLVARELGASVPWMWATNGFLGVLASVFAVFLATQYGYTAVLLLGGLAYGVTALAARARWA